MTALLIPHLPAPGAYFQGRGVISPDTIRLIWKGRRYA